MKKFLGVFSVSAFFVAVLSWGGPSGCGGAQCGDGILGGDEICDGGALNGQTCESQGFSPEGDLGCSSDCKSFDTSGCIASGTLSGLTAVSGDGDEFFNAATDSEGELFASISSSSASVTVGDKTLSNATNVPFLFRSSLARVNPDGTADFLEAFQGNTSDPGASDQLSVFHDRSGGTFFTGDYRGTQLSAPGTTLTNADATGNTFDTYAGRLKDDGSIDWLGTFNSALTDQVFAEFDPLGRLYVRGQFNGPTADANGKPLTNAGAPNFDIFVERVDPATGEAIWIASFASTGNDSVFPFFDASGNVYVEGTFDGPKLQINGIDAQTNVSAGTSDGFVARLDPADGTLDWIRPFSSGDNDFMNPLVIDPAGNVFATGVFTGATLTAETKTATNAAPGNTDGFVARLNTADGTVAWLTGVSSDQSDFPSLAVDGAGNLYLSGTFFGTSLSAGGKSLTNAEATGTSDNYVGRFDISDGSLAWLDGLQGPGFSGGIMGAFNGATDASHFYVAGSFDGATYNIAGTTFTNADPAAASGEGFVVQFNPDGTVGWADVFHGDANEFVRLQPDQPDFTRFSTGRIYIQGVFRSTAFTANDTTFTNPDPSELTVDSFVARLNPADGSFVWILPFSSDGDDFAEVVSDAFGHLALGVEFSGKTMTVNGQTFTNVDTGGTTRDGFVGRIAP